MGGFEWAYSKGYGELCDGISTDDVFDIARRDRFVGFGCQPGLDHVSHTLLLKPANESVKPT
jgi:hypothetical protein